MIVVPVKRDKIRTVDSSDVLIVSSYTGLKDEPSVYVTKESSSLEFVEIAEIAELNGVMVTASGGKMLTAQGTLARKHNLPQPGDTITVKLIDVPFKKETLDIEVKSLALGGRDSKGGLVVKTADGSFYLDDIIDIKRKTGSERFDASGFKRYYIDYFPS